MSRRLRDEERALWDSVTESTKPLKPAQRRRRTEIAADKAATVEKPGPLRAVPKTKSAPPLTPLTRRERGRIARGRSEIEARLDLHGRTLAQAHGALSRFLTRAQADGFALVLVITGKGRGGETGALRREVPQWLGLPEFRALVLGFETAHIGHGGEGALYVRLRRSR